MMHATVEDLELYVSSTLEPRRVGWLEAHCERCEACARAVATEARLALSVELLSAERRCGRSAAPERVLGAVLGGDAPSPPARSRSYVLAAAACVLLLWAAPKSSRAHGGLFEWMEPLAFADAGDAVEPQSRSGNLTEGDVAGGTP